jgi:hypothetical protein
LSPSDINVDQGGGGGGLFAFLFIFFPVNINYRRKTKNSQQYFPRFWLTTHFIIIGKAHFPMGEFVRAKRREKQISAM